MENKEKNFEIENLPIGKIGDTLCSGGNCTTIWKAGIPPTLDLTPKFEGGMFFNNDE
jgi:hypothetical protein